MNDFAVEVKDLVKTFGSFVAVDHIHFQVKRGEVFGFLGPNGAGKSTTIRLVLRLMRPTAGRVAIFGRDTGTDFIEIMKQVGALVELVRGWKD